MSIDPKTETLVTFSDARCALPGGRRVSLATLHRWRLAGVRGHKLETCLVGGRRHTSRQAIDRFIAAGNAPAPDTAPAAPAFSSAQRQRMSDAARQELAAKFGI